MTHVASPARMIHFQLGIMDIFCVIVLHAVVISGTNGLVKTLASHITLTFPDGQFGGDKVPSRSAAIDHSTLFVACIFAGSVAVVTGFFAARHLLRSALARRQTHWLCRVSACIGCVFFFLAFLFFKIGIPSANMTGSQDDYWIIADVPARRSAFLTATLVTVVFVVADALLNYRGTRNSVFVD